MADEFKLGNYIIKSEKAYNVLKNYKDISEINLAKLDKNGDKTITEDELVEVSSTLTDDTIDDKNENKVNDDDDDSDSDTDNSEDKTIENYMKQVQAYNDEITRLENKREKAYEKLDGAKDSNTDSIISECESYTSQIQSARNKIYQLFVNIEDYEEKLEKQKQAQAEAEATKAAALEAQNNISNLTQQSSTADTTSTASTASESTNTTTNATQTTSTNETITSNNTNTAQNTSAAKNTVSSSEFASKFNNSSFNKGVFAGKGDMIASVANKYGLDPNLLSAIMALETGWGTSSAVKNYNNPGGMMDPKTGSMKLMHYDSLESGVEAVAKNLKNNYIDKGLTSIAAIGAKYCPVGAANDPNGTNSGWVPNVTSIYNKLSNSNIDAYTKIA